jgi:succinate dehydrogenase / fumarate reductase cytochrome b subunit
MSVIRITSIAKKFIMALSGLFLIVFLLVHLGVNLLLLSSDQSLFNEASHFMATNPIIQVMQYVLALGFLVHILSGIALTVQNSLARPNQYASNKPSANSSIESRTMIISGVLVLLFLILHLRNFFYYIKFGYVPEGGDYILVADLFDIWYYTLIYVASFVLLGFHLNHGFQSSFQSMGANNKTWANIWKKVGTLYSIIVAGGFSIIALYHFFN